MDLVAESAENELVEMVELPNHPFFVGCQFHPEFTSTPRDGHPLFEGFVKAAREYHRANQPAQSAPAPVARKRVVSGKSVSVRLDLGGRRIIKKKKEHRKT